MFSKYFAKQDNGTYDIVRKTASFIDRKYSECFDENKLAAACLKKDCIDRLIRSDARNMIPIEKYLEAHYEYRATGHYYKNHKVKYNQNKTLYGRAQAEHALSMQAMVREVRHFIAHKKCVDVDMSSAHPTLTLWICEELGFESPKLKDYVMHRADKIAEIVDYAAEHGQTEVIEKGKAKPIDKAYVKYYMLAIVYGCGSNRINAIKHKHPWIMEFKAEMDEIAKKICQAFPRLYEDNKKRKIEQGKAYNFESSTMSHLCQYAENRVLMDMMKVLKTMAPGHVEGTALCFDGLMIPCASPEGEDFDENAFIVKCQQAIDIPRFKLEVKDMSEYHDKVSEQIDYDADIDYLEKYFNKQYYDELKTYEKVKGTFGIRAHRHFITDLEGRVWPSLDMLRAAAAHRIDEHMATMSGLAKRQYLIKTSREALPSATNVHGSIFRYYGVDKRTKEGKPKLIEIHSSDLFEGIEDRLSKIERIVYNVNDFGAEVQQEDGVLNTFPGLRAQYVDEPDMSLVQPWLDHIFKCFCNSDMHAYKWYMSWLNHAFRTPSTITRKAIILKSNNQQIAMKGTFWNNLVVKLIYGEALAAVHEGVNWISDRFNSILEHPLVHICEEAKTVYDESKAIQEYNNLKRITGGQIHTIENKCKDKRPTTCYGNIVILTNNNHVLNIPDSDRRVAFFDCNENVVKQSPEGEKLYKEKLYKLCTQSTANSFYSYCIQYTDTVDLEDIPDSEFKNNAIDDSKSDIQRFLDELDTIEEDVMHCEGWKYNAKDLAKPYSSSLLHGVYKEYCQEMDIIPMSLTTFGKEMGTTNYIRKVIRHKSYYYKPE